MPVVCASVYGTTACIVVAAMEVFGWAGKATACSATQRSGHSIAAAVDAPVPGGGFGALELCPGGETSTRPAPTGNPCPFLYHTASEQEPLQQSRVAPGGLRSYTALTSNSECW